ncbi:hypothetical protein LXL04_016643 [Taraxacum kok-saghyz]
MDIDPPAPPSSIFPDLDLKFRSQKNVAHVFWMMMLKWIRKSLFLRFVRDDENKINYASELELLNFVHLFLVFLIKLIAEYCSC